MGDIPDSVEDLLKKDLRECLPDYDEAVSGTYKLQQRNRTVRMTLMKAAREQFDGDAPEEVTQVYDPVQNVVVTHLPDPDEVETK